MTPDELIRLAQLDPNTKLLEELQKVSKILDQLDLDRLEQDRQVIDMDGWSEKKRKNRWSYRRPELGLTRTHLDDIVSTPLEEEEE